MLGATFFLLVLAFCILAGLVCISMARSMKQSAPIFEHAKRPAIDEMAVWREIKAALADLYSRYETRETARQKQLRSWAGTLVICAGICMIGILLEVQYDQKITPNRVIDGLAGQQTINVPVATHKPAAPKTNPTTAQPQQP